MKSFIKINVGHKVYDTIQNIQGVVLSIDYSTNTAQITTGSPSEEEAVTCELSNLEVLGKSNDSVPEGLNKAYESVKVFHRAFSHPISEEPTQMSLNRATPRSVWTGEEALVEFLHASASNEEEFNFAFDEMISGLYKAKEKSLAMEYYDDGIETIVAQTDALTDALYFIFGSLVEMGIKPDKLFEIVQESNMSKLFIDEEGSKYAKYRESDGKILKSEHFFEPEPKLKEEIERQSK